MLLCGKEDFKIKQGNLAERVSFKTGPEGHKEGGIYEYPNWRNYELFELLNQTQVLSLDFTSSSLR